MNWIFTAIALLMMLGATIWLLVSFFRKNPGSIEKRLKRWREIICDAFWGLG